MNNFFILPIILGYGNDKLRDRALSISYLRWHRLLFQLQRKEVESHLQSASSLHLDLARVKLDNTEVRLNITEAKLNDTEVKLNETTRELIKKLDMLQKKFENKLVEDQGNATDREKLVMARTESTDYPRVFVWKINNFNEMLRQAKTEGNNVLESVPFYTKRYGYKLRVQFHLNGCKSGKNTHLSVYIVIMKGEYDAIIAWPFKKKVRVILIDQQEDLVERENVVRPVSLSEQPKHGARPIGKENIGWGYPEFVSQKNLFSRRYLVDDTLFLQVEVGP